MSRIGNPQTFADCQSAKQQIDNLRYEKSSRAATISGDTDRLGSLRYFGCGYAALSPFVVFLSRRHRSEIVREKFVHFSRQMSIDDGKQRKVSK